MLSFAMVAFLSVLLWLMVCRGTAAAATSNSLRLGRDDSAPLVLQRGRQADRLGQRRLEGRRGLAQVRLHGAGELRQQHLAGLEVGQLADLGRRQRLALEDAALDDEQRVCLREVAQALRGLDDIAGDEGERGRTGEQVVETGDARVRRGALGQRVLRDRVGGLRPSARRSALSWATVSPRYSVSTVAVEDRKFSVSSATAVALSVRTGLSAMSLLSARPCGDARDPRVLLRRAGPSCARHTGNEKRPGAGRTGR